MEKSVVTSFERCSKRNFQEWSSRWSAKARKAGLFCLLLTLTACGGTQIPVNLAASAHCAPPQDFSRQATAEMHSAPDGTGEKRVTTTVDCATKDQSGDMLSGVAEEVTTVEIVDPRYPDNLPVKTWDNQDALIVKKVQEDCIICGFITFGTSGRSTGWSRF